MPSEEEVRRWRAVRGRFLNALWDAEHSGIHLARPTDILHASLDRLPSPQITRLVRNLSDDGLIEGIVVDNELTEIRLTSYGRAQVEQWRAEPDQPTAALPLPANQVFNLTPTQTNGGGNGNNVHTGTQGTVLQRTAKQTWNADAAEPPEALTRLVTITREAIRLATTIVGELKEIESDVDELEEQASTKSLKLGRIRIAMARLSLAYTSGVLSGIDSSVRRDGLHAIEHVQRKLGL